MDAALLADVRRVPIFSDVPDALLTAPLLRWSRRRLTAGQVLIQRDDTDRNFIGVLAGAVMAVYWTQDGRELVFSKLGPGAYLGEISVIDKAPRSISVYAQADTEVIVLDGDGFMWLIDECAAFRRRILRDLVGRVRTLTERTAAIMTQNVDQRVRGYLARLALEAGALRAGGTIDRAPTHSEIANTIGANREAVSRAISALHKSGVIEAARQRVRVLRPADLEFSA